MVVGILADSLVRFLNTLYRLHHHLHLSDDPSPDPDPRHLSFDVVVRHHIHVRHRPGEALSDVDHLHHIDVKRATDLEVVDQDSEDLEDQEDQCVVDMDHLGVAGMVIEVDMEDEVVTEDEVVMEAIGVGMEATEVDTEQVEEEEHHHLQDEINHDHDHPFEDDPVHPFVGMSGEGDHTLDQPTPAEVEVGVTQEVGVGVEVRHLGGKREVSPGASAGVYRGREVHLRRNDQSREAEVGVGVSVGA